ncbi:hypothetical protein PROFUN_00724 [Planoprotostelium fungivorum]|uniref:PDEase domain-containing protein n=1 Tax=Planoprotostelium fungivorum TaxID=1890364 RepID=A0A2P6NU66_9EUKA|nr:hypothetical protein PROFUN_00724 [Planoprotostelium fungivorum]
MTLTVETVIGKSVTERRLTLRKSAIVETALEKKEEIVDDLNAEVQELRALVDQIQIEFELIIQAYEEELGHKLIDGTIKPRVSTTEYAPIDRDQTSTPTERMLNKILENPFVSMNKYPALNGSQRSLTENTNPISQNDLSLALVHSQTLRYIDLLIPCININSISRQEAIDLATREFDILPYKEANNELHAVLLLTKIFQDLDLIDTFKIPTVTLHRFIYTIARRYRHVPFHNFYHAFNVTQTMYYFIKSCQASNILTPLETLSMIIAAMCHDCDHPGLNNDFQKKALTRISNLHKKSVLENHHFLNCVAILNKKHCNILVNLSSDELVQVYSSLRDLILATDLAIHGAILKGLEERKTELNSHWRHKRVAMSSEDKKLVMCALMKCADLSNEIRSPQIGQRWAKLVLEEFFQQSDKEKELGLPMTAFMDRSKVIIAKEQINFIEKLCLPLYSLVVQGDLLMNTRRLREIVFPQLQKCIDQLKTNRDGWKSRLNSFFESGEIKKLSNTSIWERKQSKILGNLSSMLDTRASKSPVAGRQSKIL